MSKTANKPTIILILGMHRSGTSLVTRLIAKWGASPGNELMPANEYNPEGYWEHQPLVNFHEKILQENNSSWYAPLNLPPTRELLEKYGDDARSLVQDMDISGKDWCWKDPRMPLFLDFWKTILAERKVIFVVAYRHPYKIVSSLRKRDVLPVEVSTALWEITSWNILKNLKKFDSHIVDYDAVLKNAEGETASLFQFLDKATGRSQDTKLTSEIVSAVKKDYNHESTGISFPLNALQEKIIESYKTGKAVGNVLDAQAYLSKSLETIRVFRRFKPADYVAKLNTQKEAGDYSEKFAYRKRVDVGARSLDFKNLHPFAPLQLRLVLLNDYAIIRIGKIQFFFKDDVVDLHYEISSNAISREESLYSFDNKYPYLIIGCNNPEKAVVNKIVIELEYLKVGAQVLHQLKEATDKRQLEEIRKLKVDFRRQLDYQMASQDQLRKQLTSNHETITELNATVSHLNQELVMIQKSTGYRIINLAGNLLTPSGWKKILKALKSRFRQFQDARLISRSGYFDAAYYLDNNPDVKQSGMNALKHFLLHGWKEGRHPSSLFDTRFYLLRYDDVKNSGGNPLVHYLLHGEAENRQIKNDISAEELKDRWKIKRHHRSDKQNNREAIKFKGSASMLFIGHDGGIGGGQILLLSLVKWFYQRTGIDLKIILLAGGELVENYRAIAPTLVWDECEKYYPAKDDFSDAIREFIGKVDLVYGNTVVSSVSYDELSYLKVPVITHVHELEKTIKIFESTSAIKNMRHFTSHFLVACNPVAENLIENHQVSPDKIMMVPEFIETRDLKFDGSKNELRQKLGLSETDTLVIGAGVITWRKGVDLFIETAIVLKQKGITDFYFIWIGKNYWESDRNYQNISAWDELQEKITSNSAQNHISFLSARDNFFEYFLAGDIFFLSSREDPFPLVCLEAAQCSIPVICFEKSGGMPDFVSNDAGFVVPYEDVNAVAEKIIFLQNHPDIKIELGTKAREKFLSGYTIDISAPKILNNCMQVANLHPVVSVIVPNYNYAQFLDQRLSSIFNQTFKEFEVIILDDASRDESLTIIEKYSSKPNTSVVINKVNSGSIFRQWQMGIELAKGKLIWIAESDDFSDPHFLEQMLPFFNHPDVALAHCNSNIVDDNNNITGDYTAYHLKLDFNHWKYDYRVKSTQEINFGLGVKNSILNVSSVIFRKEAIPPDIFDKLEAYRFSGDWLFYIELLKGRQIAYCSEKLNFHRRHSQTLTTQFTTDEQKRITLLQEAAKIHKRVLEIYEISPHFAEKWKFHLCEQIGAFYPNTKEEDFDKYYPYENISTKIKLLAARTEAGRKRWVFLTTNDGASMGGSEKLWIQAAHETKKRGDEVMVIIKKWEPEPGFIDDLRKAGIEVLFKKHFDFSQIVSFNPHLMIISIGDQDEGIEWYELCNASKIPYVILNQLTKEPIYWPLNEQLIPKLIKGQEDAEIVLFTGENNLRVMEKRLGHPITNSGIFYNPTGVERNIEIPYPKSGEKLQIAIVGNLHNIHKGQQLAIELFAKLKWRNRPVHLNIYGKGQDEDELKRKVQELQLSNVTFCGFANDLAEVWMKNHAILLSSFMEGLPIVLMSAMLCARVSIATDIGSHTEVISDNVSGFIASEPTVEALDEAFERAWQRKDEWETMGIQARNAILKFLPEDIMRFFINRIELFSMGNS